MTTPSDMQVLTERLITGWDAAIGWRMTFGVLALLILGLTVRLILKRDCSPIIAALWLVLGAVLGLFALFPQQFVDTVIKTEYMVRIRAIAGGISVLVLLITFESLRRTHLQERYALLWVATALVVLTAALFPGVVALFRAVTGMTYVSAVLAVTFTFLFLVAFHFSISVSGLQSGQSKIAQRLAVLEARLKRLESAKGGDAE